MTSPNVLILDEPTNDLDLDTLNVLEDYIEDFSGPVITVSHDRYFLDVVCNKIFSFEGNGNIVVNVGNYSDFIEKRDILVNNTIKPKVLEEKSSSHKSKQTDTTQSKASKPKFTYNEKREFENIDSDIEKLEEKLEQVDINMEAYSSDYTKLEEFMKEKETLEDELMNKLEKQEYFINLEKEIEEYK